MPPTCTPEKKNDYQQEKQLSCNSNEVYFITSELHNPKLSARDGADEEAKQVASLTKTFPELDKFFFLHKRVGFGTFSTVYLASLKADDTFQKRYAVKHIVPTCHPNRIKTELKCLKDIGGVDNVAGIDMCLRNKNNVIFIMPYQPHDCFSNYVGKMDSKELACYMKNLLKAVARVHEFNIVHRDIKPSNFLYDRKNKRFLLVDFGLAHSVIQKPDVDIKLERKRKRDLSSYITNEITQETKRQSQFTMDKHGSRDIKQGTSQKENNPREDVTKVVGKNLTLINEPETCFQDVSNRRKKTRSHIVLTKISPTTKSRAATKNVAWSNLNPETQECACYGRPKTCTRCVVKKNLRALRAGTPGFRPPEVLLKLSEQDTAVDIWAAGIIMLSVLSNCCNFFSSPDDMTALAEIILIFGYEEVKKLASQCGRYLICSEKNKALDLRKICCILHSRGNTLNLMDFSHKCTDCGQPENLCVCVGKPLHSCIKDEFPDAAYDLLKRLLDISPKTRISAKKALEHPFLNDI